MNGSFRLLACAALAALAVPLAAQQEVHMRGNTPVAPNGLKIPPLPTAPVVYETAEGQTIRVSVYARGFQNPWSMAWVSDDTILVAERGGAIKAVRNGVVDPQPVPGAPVCREQTWHSIPTLRATGSCTSATPSLLIPRLALPPPPLRQLAQGEAAVAEHRRRRSQWRARSGTARDSPA
jgi:hypothetical protein